MNEYEIRIHNDHHGDITGLEFFENGILKAKNGYEDCSTYTEIKRQGYWSGPMWVIYNTLKDANRLIDTMPQTESVA